MSEAKIALLASQTDGVRSASPNNRVANIKITTALDANVAPRSAVTETMSEEIVRAGLRKTTQIKNHDPRPIISESKTTLIGSRPIRLCTVTNNPTTRISCTAKKRASETICADVERESRLSKI